MVGFLDCPSVYGRTRGGEYKDIYQNRYTHFDADELRDEYSNQHGYSHLYKYGDFYGDERDNSHVHKYEFANIYPNPAPGVGILGRTA